MKDNKIIAAAVLGVCLIVFGFILKAGIDNYINKDRQVTVKGLSEREVPANKVTWGFQTYVTGNDLRTLYREINQTNAVVLRFLTDNGLSREDVTILPPEVTDLVSETYSYSNRNFDYKLTTSITVTSTDVELVQSIVEKQGDLIAKGIALGGYNHISYDYTGFQDLKQSMIEEAVANARVTADQFVKNYGSELGKIITADQGQFSIYSKDDNPKMMKVRGVATITYAID